MATNAEKKISIETLREYFEVREDGALIIKKRYGRNGRVGAVGSVVSPRATNSAGYRQMKFEKCGLLQHRVVFALIFGRWPASEIDHINQKRADNRPENLREANASQNCGNSKASNGRVFKGVSLRREKRHSKPFTAQIRIAGRATHLGYFATPILAALEYDKAARAYFGTFPCCNFRDGAQLNGRLSAELMTRMSVMQWGR